MTRYMTAVSPREARTSIDRFRNARERPHRSPTSRRACQLGVEPAAPLPLKGADEVCCWPISPVDCASQHRHKVGNSRSATSATRYSIPRRGRFRQLCDATSYIRYIRSGAVVNLQHVRASQPGKGVAVPRAAAGLSRSIFGRRHADLNRCPSPRILFHDTFSLFAEAPTRPRRGFWQFGRNPFLRWKVDNWGAVLAKRAYN
jgi:hypothetical protein